MKLISILLVFVLLLAGCAAAPVQESPEAMKDLNYAVLGDGESADSEGHYISNGGMLSNGGISALPEDKEDNDDQDNQDDQDDQPVDVPEIDAILVGNWEYVDTMNESYTLSFNNYGAAEIKMYSVDANGNRSLVYSMSDAPVIEDGRITFSADVEYGPPSLVLQLEYVEDVGDILTVVSSADSFASLTEYFYLVR